MFTNETNNIKNSSDIIITKKDEDEENPDELLNENTDFITETKTKDINDTPNDKEKFTIDKNFYNSPNKNHDNLNHIQHSNEQNNSNFNYQLDSIELKDEEKLIESEIRLNTENEDIKNEEENQFNEKVLKDEENAKSVQKELDNVLKLLEANIINQDKSKITRQSSITSQKNKGALDKLDKTESKKDVSKNISKTKMIIPVKKATK